MACEDLFDPASFIAMHRKCLRRHEVSGTARFLTFSCYHLLPLFQNDRIKQEWVDRLTAVSEASAVDVLAWVVMPNHVHLVVFSESTTMTAFLKQLKGPFSRTVLRRWKALNAPILAHVTTPDGAHFWQAGGGYDRNIVGHELLEKIRYCHKNPVEASLVARSVDWAWSSARRYEHREDAIGPAIRFDLLPDGTRDLT